MATNFNTSNINGFTTTFNQLRINRYGADAILTDDQIAELRYDSVQQLNSAGFEYDISDFEINTVDSGIYKVGLTDSGQTNYNDSQAQMIEASKQVDEYGMSSEDSFYNTPIDSTVVDEYTVTGGDEILTAFDVKEYQETTESQFWQDEVYDLEAEFQDTRTQWLADNPDMSGADWIKSDQAQSLYSEIDEAEANRDAAQINITKNYDADGNLVGITESTWDYRTGEYTELSSSEYQTADQVNEQLNREAFDDVEATNDEEVVADWTSDDTTVSNVNSAGNPVMDTDFDDDGNIVTTYADGSVQVHDEDGNLVSGPTDAELATNTASVENSYDNSQIIQNPVDEPSVSEQRTGVNKDDWRVRLRLAPQSDYLYNATDPGILAPLKPTDGVIFPYTPSITTAHVARYNPYDLPHSNYRGYFYSGSNQNEIVINAKFTAQDSKEAQYLLAVMHFLRSCTKMFYGQDAQRGTPPPLVFLSGLGDHQFNEHPCVVSNVNINLPPDVDYISTSNTSDSSDFTGPTNKQSNTSPNFVSSVLSRLFGTGLGIGGVQEENPYGTAYDSSTSETIFSAKGESRVPTSMEIYFNLLPIQTRSQVSDEYSLKDYASGKLLKRGYW